MDVLSKEKTNVQRPIITPPAIPMSILSILVTCDCKSVILS